MERPCREPRDERSASRKFDEALATHVREFNNTTILVQRIYFAITTVARKLNDCLSVTMSMINRDSIAFATRKNVRRNKVRDVHIPNKA